MKQYVRVDENGLFLEPVLFRDGDEIPEDVVTAEVPEGLYLPKWDGEQWIEGRTPQEIDDILNAPVTPTDTDILGQQLVQREIEIMQLQGENAMLGLTLVDLELRLMTLEGGGA